MACRCQEGNVLPSRIGQLTLAFVGMADEVDERTYRYRRGYWLRGARRRAGLNLESVAKAMQYSSGSASTFSLWEDGKRDPSDVQLRRIAAVYGVPVEIFSEPDETDEERLERRIQELRAERARRELREAQ